MYTQHSRQRDAAAAAVPRNYSGNAFRYPPPTSIVPSGTAARTDEVETPPKEEHGEAQEREGMTSAVTSDASAEEGGERLHLSSLLSHALDNEQLLLVGLLLLLRGEQDMGDLPLYLLLLLFLG